MTARGMRATNFTTMVFIGKGYDSEEYYGRGCYGEED